MGIECFLFVKTWIPFIQGCFVLSLVEICPVVLEKKIFNKRECIFAVISPWKRAGPFIWINLNPLHPRMLCAKFGWNWPSGSGEDFNFVNVLSLFCNYLPLEKGGALHLNKLEFPSPKDDLCQFRLIFRFWIWRFLKFVNIFSLFSYYFPWKRTWPIHLN